MRRCIANYFTGTLIRTLLIVIPNKDLNCDAPFLYDRKKNELIRRNTADYVWHFTHFTHFIKTGAVRIGMSRGFIHHHNMRVTDSFL